MLEIFSKGGGSTCVYPEYVVGMPAVSPNKLDGGLCFSRERVEL